MADYSIWVVEYGFVDQFPVSNLLAAQPNEGRRRMPYCFGLLRSADGRAVLVDTGFYDPGAKARLTAKYGLNYWISPVAALERVGVAAGEVDTVLLTHNHFDHAGCVAEFPNARVWIQRREMDAYREALALPPRFAFLLRSCAADLPGVLAQRAADGQLSYADGRAQVLPGIEVRPAFDTHTAGSQFVLVDNGADGPWLFAGDNVYSYQNIEGLAGDGVLEPIGTATGSAATWLRCIDQALDLVGSDTRRVLPFHEQELFARFASRQFGDGLHVAQVSLAGGHGSVLAGQAPAEDEAERVTLT